MSYTEVFLADDDADDRMFFEEAFEELNYNFKMKSFKDGIFLMEYLKLNENNYPKIIFLDINMQRKTGLEFLQEMRQESKLKDIIIAIYSTSNSTENIKSAFDFGANTYIKKPNTFNDLKSMISNVLKFNWSEQLQPKKSSFVFNFFILF